LRTASEDSAWLKDRTLLVKGSDGSPKHPSVSV
jgi:hypothetical protein